ncbi:hypothetical protein [Fulvivirga marina]|nr:hypothetical protein [Fulvivirga marina]
MAVNYPDDYKSEELSKDLTASIVVNANCKVSKIKMDAFIDQW